MRKQWFWYVSVFSILVFATFGNILHFTFWKDEWASYMFYTHWNTAKALWMHPGGIFLESLQIWIFGSQVWGWQLMGILLKIFASFAVMEFITVLTRSRRAGILGGIFFAVSAISADAVSWAAAHVGLLDVILVCCSLSFGIVAFREEKQRNFAWSSLSGILAVVADPVRTVPFLGIGFLYCLWFTEIFEKKNVRRIVFWIFLGGLGAISLFLFCNTHTFFDTQIVKYIITYQHEPLRIFGRVYLLGRFYNSLVVMATGWILPLYEEASTSIPTFWGASFGYACFIVYIYLFIRAWMKKNENLRTVVFFLTWIGIFYLPNFFVEPRLVYGVTHRFFTISSVGFIGLLAYMVSRISSSRWSIFFTLVIVSANVFTVHKFIGEQMLYRDKKLTEYVYKTVNEKLPKDRRSLFLITGNHPFVQFGAGYAMNAPIIFYRDLTDKKTFPLYAHDVGEAYRIFCQEKDISGLMISDMYAWEIAASSVMREWTERARQEVNSLWETKNCVFTK